MIPTQRSARTTSQTPRRLPRLAPEERLLSPTRAFVVQFREEREGEAPRFAGRVEHATSGEAARFESPEDLLAFFARVMRAGHAEGWQRG